jgi:hypothetical protein
MTPESLGQMLEAFLGCSRHAVVLEDGAIVFDLPSIQSISGEIEPSSVSVAGWMCSVGATRNSNGRALESSWPGKYPNC